MRSQTGGSWAYIIKAGNSGTMVVDVGAAACDNSWDIIYFK